MNDPATRQDPLFAATFGSPELAARNLEALLPSFFPSQLKLSGLEVLPGTYVDAELRHRYSDLAYLVPRRKKRGPAIVYLLCGEEGTGDKLAPLRLVRFMFRVWEQWIEGRRVSQPEELPWIVPVWLFHEDGKLMVARELSGRLTWTGEESTQLDHIIRYIYCVWDIAPDELAELMGSVAGEGARERALSTAETFRQQGRREVMLRLLRQRFGTDLPESVVLRLTTRSKELLDQWVERIFAARSLDEVFAE